MKPRLSFGRRQDTAHATQPEAAGDDVEVELRDDAEDHSPLVESTRPSNEAPIRPDLGDNLRHAHGPPVVECH